MEGSQSPAWAALLCQVCAVSLDSSQLPGTPTLPTGVYTVGPWASCPPRVSLGHKGSHPGEAMGQREACSLSGLGHHPLFGQLPFAERPLPLMSFGRRHKALQTGLVCLMLPDQGFGGRMCRNKDVSWGSLLCWLFCLLLRLSEFDEFQVQSARIGHRRVSPIREAPNSTRFSSPCVPPPPVFT